MINERLTHEKTPKNESKERKILLAQVPSLFAIENLANSYRWKRCVPLQTALYERRIKRKTKS